MVRVYPRKRAKRVEAIDFLSWCLLLPILELGECHRCCPAFFAALPKCNLSTWQPQQDQGHGIGAMGSSVRKAKRGRDWWGSSGEGRGGVHRDRRGRGRLTPARVTASEALPPQGAAAAAVEGGSDARDGGKYRLMLVDDEEALRRAVSGYLEQRGYGITSHASAQEALSSLEDYTEGVHNGEAYSGPDLIISDVTMPDMDGYEFLKALRSGGVRERSIPVVFLTARGMTEDRIQGYRAGVNAYLSKPFDPEELVSIIDNVLFIRARTAEAAAAEKAGESLPPTSSSSSLPSSSSPTSIATSSQSVTSTAISSSSTASLTPSEAPSVADDKATEGVVDSSVLDDVRELGDIKALLMADRAHRRDTAGHNSGRARGESRRGGSGALENNSEGSRLLLTSSKDSPTPPPSSEQFSDQSSEQSSDRSSDRFRAPLDDPFVIDASLSTTAAAAAGSRRDASSRRVIEEWSNGDGQGLGLRDEMVYMPPVLLSAREVTVLELLLQGYTNREIAKSIGLSVRSVEKHVSNMLAKTGTSNRTELVRYSMRENLVKSQDF